MNGALEKAWDDVASKLRGYIRSRIRDHTAAEDILQDVFVKAHSRVQKSDVKNVEGWLFQIARNAVIDHYRKVKPTEELPVELAGESESLQLEHVEGLRESFLGMVDTLPEPYREAVILTEFEGLTQRELAERLGISLSGAKSRVQRGRAQLKKALLECCTFEFDRRGNIIECQSRKNQCQCEN
ncbi:MAG: RNA polymerase sigma factor SigZ [Verrucomicrobiota bacterium]|nr:RNA polymerase sigma factor SigZ [Verrucomicrobiota bacterium]